MSVHLPLLFPQHSKPGSKEAIFHDFEPTTLQRVLRKEVPFLSDSRWGVARH
jgi:hypothetical protein